MKSPQQKLNLSPKGGGGNILLGFIILIAALIFVFIGLPYLLKTLKSNRLSYYPSSTDNAAPAASSGYVRNVWRAQSHYNDSVYKGRVIITGINRGNNQQIIFAALANSAGPVNINGWKIATSRLNDFVVGPGLQSVGFGAAGDIVLTAGNQVKVWAGQSPIAANFRVNKCLGLISGINFDIAPPAGQTTYNSCVQARQNDIDFYKEWRVYAGSFTQLFDPLHDTIQLKDQSGFIVDQYQY